MAHVLMPLAVGFEEIEAVTITDILRRAGIEVVMAGLDREHVCGAHGITIYADMLLDEVELSSFDMIVLPGGLPGAEHLAKSEKVQQVLQYFDRDNKRIGAICAAPWALATAGVLKDKYTCYPSFEETIGHTGYVSDSNVVQDHNIITSRGPSTAMEFALAIVKELCGEETYVNLRKGLLLS